MRLSSRIPGHPAQSDKFQKCKPVRTRSTHPRKISHWQHPDCLVWRTCCNDDIQTRNVITRRAPQWERRLQAYRRPRPALCPSWAPPAARTCWRLPWGCRRQRTGRSQRPWWSVCLTCPGPLRWWERQRRRCRWRRGRPRSGSLCPVRYISTHTSHCVDCRPQQKWRENSPGPCQCAGQHRPGHRTGWSWPRPTGESQLTAHRSPTHLASGGYQEVSDLPHNVARCEDVMSDSGHTRHQLTCDDGEEGRVLKRPVRHLPVSECSELILKIRPV